MALALLGASEYVEEIAQVLRGEDSLSRLGAMGALGILKAKKYAPEIARQMRADKGFGQSYAAAALVLMESEEYGPEAVAVIEGGLNLELFDFDLPPGLEDRAKALRERLKKSFALLKGRAKAGRPEAGAKP